MPIWKINFCSIFQYYLDGERGHKPPCVFENGWEVEISRDRFNGSVFIIDLNIPKVFAETVTQSSACFSDVYFYRQHSG